MLVSWYFRRAFHVDGPAYRPRLNWYFAVYLASCSHNCMKVRHWRCKTQNISKNALTSFGDNNWIHWITVSSLLSLWCHVTCTGGSLSLDGFEFSCDAYSSTLDHRPRVPVYTDDDADDDSERSPSPSASMSVVGQRDSFISNDSPSAIFNNSPFNNFFFFDSSLATSSSGASNQAASLHPPLKPVTYRRQLETWKWRHCWRTTDQGCLPSSSLEHLEQVPHFSPVLFFIYSFFHVLHFFPNLFYRGLSLKSGSGD